MLTSAAYEVSYHKTFGDMPTNPTPPLRCESALPRADRRLGLQVPHTPFNGAWGTLS